MEKSELVEELAVEFDAMRQTISRTKQLLEEIRGESPSETEAVAIATYVANLYAGLERILLRVVKAHRAAPPEGPAWHRRLLDLFRPGSASGMPELVPESLAVALGRFLTFRHVFVHGYAVRLDWSKLRPAAESASAVFEQFLEGVDAWLGKT